MVFKYMLALLIMCSDRIAINRNYYLCTFFMNLYYKIITVRDKKRTSRIKDYDDHGCDRRWFLVSHACTMVFYHDDNN